MTDERIELNSGDEWKEEQPEQHSMSITLHYDKRSDEWVIRLHHNGGYTPLCGCPGRMEAETVATCISAVLAAGEVTFEERGDGIHKDGLTFKAVSVAENSLDEWNDFAARMRESWEKLKEMTQ